MHEAEVRRGWVCLACAMEAVGKSQATVYRWRDEKKVACEKVAGRVYFKLEDLVHAEATTRPGRPPASDPK